MESTSTAIVTLVGFIAAVLGGWVGSRWARATSTRNRDASTTAEPDAEWLSEASIPACIVQGGVIRLVNPPLETVLAGDDATAVGRPLWEILDPGLDDAFMCAVLAAERGQGPTIPVPGAVRRRGAESAPVRVVLTTTRYRDRPAAVVMLLEDAAHGADSDLTERVRRLEARLREVHRNEIIGRLARGVVHDFNNTLTAVLGYADILKLRVDEDGPLRRPVDGIRNAVSRTASMTRQLMSLTRHGSAQPRRVNLNLVVETLVRLMERLLDEDIELEVRLQDGLWDTRVDPIGIEKTLMLLLVAARDSMTRGGRLRVESANLTLDGEPTADRCDLSPGPHVVLTVGYQGVHDEERAHSWLRSWTAAGDGPALGLAAVGDLVETIGGVLEVSSELGTGTVCRVYLPKADPPPKREVREVRDVRSEPVRPHGTTILLVEDERAVRDLIRSVLEGLGYAVLTAGRGTDAIAVAERHSGSIDLLMTDVVLPGMNGSELADQLRNRRPETKVVFMSGHGEEVVERHGVRRRQVEFLDKPFSADILARKLDELFSN